MARLLGHGSSIVRQTCLMDALVAQQVRDTLDDCVVRTLQRLDAEDTHRPFHSRLISAEAIFWSRFERSFSTSFGQSVIEKISELICVGAGSEATRQRASQVTLTTTQWDEIETIVRHARSSSSTGPDWDTELAAVVAAGAYGVSDTRRVISDLWWRRDGVEHFMSIKTVKPNLDQTAEAKRDLLKLAAANPDARVHFGLYYNPYGESSRDYGFSPPQRLFDFSRPSPVLIGEDYWNLLGGDGTYEHVLEIASEVGERLAPKLREYAEQFTRAIEPSHAT